MNSKFATSMLIIMIVVIVFGIINYILSTNDSTSKSDEWLVVSEVSDDIPSITAEELFAMLMDNPYNAKVTFETPTRVTGIVESISTDGMSISIGNDDISVNCSVRDIYYLGRVYKCTRNGEEVLVEQRKVFKKYSQQLSKGDTISLIGSDLYEKSEGGYIVVVKNFDIKDVIKNVGVESEEALFDMFGLFN